MKAQAEGYFTSLNLLPVEEFDQDQTDSNIAIAATEQLRKDWGILNKIERRFSPQS